MSDPHVRVGDGPGVVWHNRLLLEDSLARLDSAVADLARRGADLIVVAGDLTHDGDRAAAEAALGALRASPVPVFVVPGNHDLVGGACMMRELVGPGAGRIRLASGAGEIVLPGLRIAGASMLRGRDDLWASGAPDVAGWGADLVVFLSHFPVISLGQRCERADLRYAGDAADRAQTEALIAVRPGPTIVVSGHTHVRDVVAAGSLIQCSCPALVEPPAEVALLTVRPARLGGGLRLDLDHHGVAADAPVRLPVLAPRASSWRHLGTAGWTVAQAPRTPSARRPGATRSEGVAMLACDWNGTLTDDAEEARHATNAVLRTQGRADLSRAGFRAAFRLPLSAFFAEVGDPGSAEAATRLWDEQMALARPPLQPNAEALLRGAAELGVRVGIVSAAAPEVVDAQIAHHNLSDLVDFVDAGARVKRATLAALVAAHPGRVMYIGDTEFDVREAIAAGARAIGYGQGYRPGAALRAAGAEIVVDDLAAVLRRLQLPPRG